MKVLLAIIFLVQGEPTIVEGYFPLEMESREYCEMRKDFTEAYLATVPGMPEFRVVCGTQEEIQSVIDAMDDVAT